MKSILVILVAIISAIYLVNPGAGVIEFIPDVLPIVGNIDEATAAAILLACARYFGFDFSGFFGRRGDGASEKDVVDVD